MSCIALGSVCVTIFFLFLFFLYIHLPTTTTNTSDNPVFASLRLEYLCLCLLAQKKKKPPVRKTNRQTKQKGRKNERKEKKSNVHDASHHAAPETDIKPGALLAISQPHPPAIEAPVFLSFSSSSFNAIIRRSRCDIPNRRHQTPRARGLAHAQTLRPGSDHRARGYDRRVRWRRWRRRGSSGRRER